MADSAKKNGQERQLDQLTEECAELIVAVNHFRRGRITAEQMQDEMADVLLMLMACSEYGGSLEAATEAKLLKVKAWVESDEEDHGE